MLSALIFFLVAADPAGPSFTKHVIDPDLPAISVTTLDVDGDGRLDVVAAGGPSGGPSRWSNLVYWYRAPDWEKRPVAVLDPQAVILHVAAMPPVIRGRGNNAPPAGAGRAPEVVITDGQLGRVWGYRYEAERWTSRLILDRVPFAHGIALGDLDGDGRTDVLAPHQGPGQPAGVLWAKNPGPAAEAQEPWTTFPLSERFDITGWLHYPALADLNGDGRLDALLASDGERGWLGYWLAGPDPRRPWEFHALATDPPASGHGPASAAASEPASAPGLAVVRQTTNLEAADLDGDGKPDLVAAEGHGRGLWWFLAPDFKPRRLEGSEALAAAHSLALADFDGDGRTDVASCGYESKRVMLFLNRGGGQFQPLTLDEDQAAYGAHAVDLDADGDMDLLVAGQNSGNLVWYENKTRTVGARRN